MKTKIISAFENISKKNEVDNVIGRIQTVLMASIQSENFDDVISEFLGHTDYVVDTYFKADETEE